MRGARIRFGSALRLIARALLAGHQTRLRHQLPWTGDWAGISRFAGQGRACCQTGATESHERERVQDIGGECPQDLMDKRAPFLYWHGGLRSQYVSTKHSLPCERVPANMPWRIQLFRPRQARRCTWRLIARRFSRRTCRVRPLTHTACNVWQGIDNMACICVFPNLWRNCPPLWRQEGLLSGIRAGMRAGLLEKSRVAKQFP